MNFPAWIAFLLGIMVGMAGIASVIVLHPTPPCDYQGAEMNGWSRGYDDGMADCPTCECPSFSWMMYNYTPNTSYIPTNWWNLT